MTPGQVVRELRQMKGWSQAILSQITDIAVSNISNIESGRSRLGEDRAILLAEALGVKPELLLFPNGFEREELKQRLNEIQKRVRKLEGEAGVRIKFRTGASRTAQCPAPPAARKGDSCSAQRRERLLCPRYRAR